ncbi:MAG TPA: nickel ABC transporter permease [Thermomicrobiales bacterium]|nr:nickel ABC transporter permease [Thermomicrobiales bacterium]
MFRYFLYRLAAVIPVLFGVSIAVFVMVRLVPGDPVQLMFTNQPLPSPERLEEIRHQLGLDLPIWKQYLNYLTGVLQGDFGQSIRSRQPVFEEIVQRLPNTLRLTFASLAVAITVGILAGVLSAVYKGRWIDKVSMVVSILGISIPGFWFGLMIMLLFGVRLEWLPVSGATSWKHLVMPAITLGLISSAIIARLTRASMLDALGQDYVRTARAKGLRGSTVVTRHALRNAFIPVVTIIGLQIGGLLSGAFIIETVFAYPGVGQLAVTALQARDFPVIQGIVLMVAAIYVCVNLLADLVYGFLDPRIQYS